jgi:hypothetical protein
MRRLWNRRGEGDHSGDWPEPRPEFLEAVADRVRSAGHHGTGRVRLAFAGVLALALLVGLSAFGGVGYAARQAEKAAKAAAAPFTSDAATSTAGPQHKKPPKDDDDDDGYDDKCKDLKDKLHKLKRKHHREWRALLAEQWRERKNFDGKRGSRAWHRLLKDQWREREALKREQRAERRELEKAIKKCKKDRDDDDDDDDDKERDDKKRHK